MKVKELIKTLKKLPPEKEILTQVCPTEGSNAWTMFFDVHDFSKPDWCVQLRVWHPELVHLPEWPGEKRATHMTHPGWTPSVGGPMLDVLHELFQERVSLVKAQGICADPDRKAKDDLRTDLRRALGWK